MGIPASLARSFAVIGLICTFLYAIPRTAVLGAILLINYMGGAVASHLRLADPLLTQLFCVYLGLLARSGLFLRNARLRVHSHVDSEQSRVSMTNGWTGTMDQLEAYLATAT